MTTARSEPLRERTMTFEVRRQNDQSELVIREWLIWHPAWLGKLSVNMNFRQFLGLSKGKLGVTCALCPFHFESFHFAHFPLSISNTTSQWRDSIVLERWAGMRKEYKNHCLKGLHLDAIYCWTKRVEKIIVWKDYTLGQSIVSNERVEKIIVWRDYTLRQSIVSNERIKKIFFERITP